MISYSQYLYDVKQVKESHLQQDFDQQEQLVTIVTD